VLHPYILYHANEDQLYVLLYRQPRSLNDS